MTSKQYDLISPDGFSFMREGYFNSEAEAWEYFNTNVLPRYERQGYYSSTAQGRIPLSQLKAHCRLVLVELDPSEIDGIELNGIGYF
jgi:hypothetical protein